MLLITIIISVIVIAHVLAIAIVVNSIKRKDVFTMKRFIAITTTIMLTVFLMINFINQYKEEQRILNYQLTVQEDRYGLYHKDGKYDKKKNIVYLNRRTKGVVQSLENNTKAEVVKAILYLLNK